MLKFKPDERLTADALLNAVQKIRGDLSR